MSSKRQTPFFDPDEHYRNRERWHPQDLAPYYGKEVAWSLDGNRILASGDDARAVCQAVLDAGLRSDEVVLGYVPFPQEILLGSAIPSEDEVAQ